MPISIFNTSEMNGMDYGKGLQSYAVAINNTFIVAFYHTYEDGLAECLRQASIAVGEAKLKESANE